MLFPRVVKSCDAGIITTSVFQVEAGFQPVDQADRKPASTDQVPE